MSALSEKFPHCAGTEHVIPIHGSAGYARVVARGCQGVEDAGYFSAGDEDCALGYTWSCEECPALPARWIAVP